MPNPYINPDLTPPVGPYQWVPSTIPDGQGTPYGFDDTGLERGQYRYDLPVASGYTDGTINVSYTGTLVSGDPGWPILAAFRYLARPSQKRQASPNQPFVLNSSSNTFTYELALVNDSNLSAMTISYCLLVDLTDATLVPHLTPEDAQKVAAYKPGGAVPSIDWTQYAFGKVTVVNSSNQEVEYPVVSQGGTPVELQATGPLISGVSPVERINTTIKFGSGVTSGAFPSLKTVKISNRYGIASLQLQVFKVLLFNAEAVNIRNEQLPCALLEYAFPVSVNFDVALGTATIPDNRNVPNVHVKIFSPDYVTGSPGFAHSISLRILMFAMQLSGLDPTGIDPIYEAVYLGPIPGRLSIAYGLTNISAPVLTSTPGMIVRLDASNVLSNAVIIHLQKSSITGTSAPTDDSSYSTITAADYNINNPPTIDYFGKSGPFIQEYSYLDKSGTTTSWYRTVQVLQDGSTFIGQPFQGSFYIERQPFKMLDASNATTSLTSVTRRIRLASDLSPLEDAHPIAIFTNSDEASPLASPVTFGSGPWKLRVEGESIDPNLLVNTYLYARIWFVPENYVIDMDNPHNYRDETEFYFTSTTTTTQVIRGTPNSLNQLMVFPPMPRQNAYLEAVRYADSAKGVGISNDAWTLPASFKGLRAKIVVAFYTMSTLTTDGASQNLLSSTPNSPSINIRIDSGFMQLETTIKQIQSHELFPQIAGLYSSSDYTSYSEPLTASRSLVGGDILAGSGNFISYNKQFISSSASSTNSLTSSSVTGLCQLSPTSTDPVGICIPFSKIPNVRDSGIFVTADFATQSNKATLASGRVMPGTWKIAVTLDKGSDNDSVLYDFRFEALLVSTSGYVACRIFRSDYIPGIQAGVNVGAEVNITIPFLIDSSECELVIRVNVFPYSKNGKTVDISAITKALGSTPFGARIQSLSLVSHTLQVLEVHQTDSVLGSPAFYEDLPITPTQSLDGNTFWYMSTPDWQNAQTVNVSTGANVTGTLFSPAWFVSLPENMEVQLGAAGFSNPLLWFRTVLGSTSSAISEQSVSAQENHIGKQVFVAHDIPSSATSESTSSTGTVIRHISSDHAYQTPYSDTTLSGTNGTATQEMAGQFPSLFFMKTRSDKSGGGLLAVIAQINESDGPSFTSAINSSSGADASWLGPNRDLGDQNFGAVRRVAQALQNPTAVISNDGLNVYIGGWTSPGTILVREVNIFDAGTDSSLAEGRVFLIDGEPNPDLVNNETIISPVGALNGTANRTFPGMCIDAQGRLSIAYTIQGLDGLLYMRQSISGMAFTSAFPIVSIMSNGIPSSSDLAISGPSLAIDSGTGSIYAAFWCAGRIFITAIQGCTPTTSAFSPLQLVAGPNDFSKPNNANLAFQALVSLNDLRVDQLGVAEAEIPKQRVGLYISNSPPYQGNAFVYYVDSNQNLWFRQVRIGGITGPQTPVGISMT